MILPQNRFPLLRIMGLTIDHGRGHFDEGRAIGLERSFDGNSQRFQ